MKARIFFCLVPALLCGGLFAFIHPVLGSLVMGVVFGLGWDVTLARSERGETNAD